MTYEKRIAVGLLKYDLAQSVDVLPAAQTIAEQLSDIRLGERLQRQGRDRDRALAQLLDHQRQRLAGRDLLIAICADKEDMLPLRIADQRLQQLGCFEHSAIAHLAASLIALTRSNEMHVAITQNF